MNKRIALPLVLTLLSVPFLAGAADLSWHEIGSKLIHGTDDTATKLQNFIIEAQPCENSGKIPKITFAYETDGFSAAATDGVSENSGWYQGWFPEEVAGGYTSIGIAVNQSDGITTIYKIWPRYCVVSVVTGSPRPAVRIRLKTQNENQAIIYGTPIASPTPSSVPPSTPPGGTNSNAGGAGNGSTVNNNDGIHLENPLGKDATVITLLKSIFKAMREIMYVIVPIFILVGAFQMMFAQGNPEKFAKGQKTIIYSIIGLVIIIMASGIVAIVQSLLTV